MELVPLKIKQDLEEFPDTDLAPESSIYGMSRDIF